MLQLFSPAFIPLLESLACTSVQPITHGGSGKKIWRLFCPGESFILMQNLDPQIGVGGLDENQSFLLGLKILKDLDLPGPDLIKLLPEQKAFLLKDLGDMTLQKYLEESNLHHDPASRHKVLEQIASDLSKWQVRGTKFLERDLYHAPDYDKAFMRREESGYFFREFVSPQLPDFATPKLEAELDALAEKTSQFDATFLIHRDFQSSNVMMVEGRPATIDFQGLRRGPLAYDVASFLEDAYVQWSPEDKRHFLTTYLAQLQKLGLSTHQLQDFQKSLPFVASHRMMQAIGAFSKLANTDGKTWFLKWRPIMLGRLNALVTTPDFCEFPTLVNTLQAAKTSGLFD